jgi:hypothetical protein
VTRAAFLDLEAATSQLQVAGSNRKAAKSLDLTRQRLELGSLDSVGSPGAETAATVELDYITSLLAHNCQAQPGERIGKPEDKLTQYLPFSDGSRLGGS